jgi:hypothetical protein
VAADENDAGKQLKPESGAADAMRKYPAISLHCER